MNQTFIPKHNYAKAFGTNMRISTKSAIVICNVIRNKPLTRARRLLEDLNTKKRSLDGKYYSKAVKGVLEILDSCEKNAGFKGLDADRLFVHASAHRGASIRRRRRKGAFGSTLKNTNLEVLLIERGKEGKDRVSKEKIKEQMEKKQEDKIGKEIEQERVSTEKELKKEIEELKEEQKKLEEDVKDVSERRDLK